MVQFESFINQHYPRKKFAELWRRLYQVRLRQALGSKITAPDIFRALFKSRELLQSIVTVGNWVAETSNTKRPALQICAGCGRFFLARRKDAQTCSPKCSARVRMARVRAKRKIYELTIHSLSSRDLFDPPLTYLLSIPKIVALYLHPFVAW